MSRSRYLLGTIFFCEHCQKETRFMPIHFAIQEIGVSRTTMYNWMQRKLLHWVELPSGRAMICQQSLMQRARNTRDTENVTYFPRARSPKNSPQTA
jgi:predicted site-specific integrase-resolvase